MCRCLRIQPSGFYAWLTNPLSKRAREDVRQTGLIREAWKDSGKVYGYRKLHDDLLDQGETCCPNRVARLATLAGIKARIRRSPEMRIRRSPEMQCHRQLRGPLLSIRPSDANMRRPTGFDRAENNEPGVCPDTEQPA